MASLNKEDDMDEEAQNVDAKIAAALATAATGTHLDPGTHGGQCSRTEPLARPRGHP